MGNKGKQFILLLWKNYVIQKRKVVTTIFEIGLPTFFALILIFIRLRVKGEMKEQQVWETCHKWKDLNTSLPTRVAFSPDDEVVRRVIGNLNKSIPTLRPGKNRAPDKKE